MLSRVLLSLGAVAMVLWPVRALEVVDLDRSCLVALYPADRFRLRYRHSVYGGMVWEEFRLARGELVLEGLEAEQEAALEYYGLPGRVSRANKLYAIRGLRQRFRELVVRATATGERTLLLGRWTLALYRDREGHRLRLRAVRVPAAWLGLGAAATLLEVWKNR